MVIDSPVAQFVRTSLGGALIVAFSLTVFGLTLLWAIRSGHDDRRAALIAGVAGAVLVFLLNVVFGSTGMWRSTEYTLPAVVLGSLLLLIASVLAWVVACYRWLSAHRAGRVVALALLGLATALVPVVDNYVLSRGYIAFRGGYSVWMDALVAVAIFVVPVAVYEWLNRHVM